MNRENMHIKIIYSMPFRKVKRRSKQFFSGTKYVERNGVYSHAEQDSIFSINKNVIYIHVPNDTKITEFTNQYLVNVFDDSVIGIEESCKYSPALSNLNYVLI